MSYQPPPPGQPIYGPPPGYPHRIPPRPPRKKTLVWPWILMGVGILFLGGCIAIIGTAANDTSKTATTNPAAAAPQGGGAPAATAAPKAKGSNVAPAGSEVRDGKFAFAVTAVDPPTPAVGSGFWAAKAKGEFIVVHVDITNVGNEPRSYFDDNQKLYDDQNRQFANNSSAARGLGSETYASDLNPGFKISVAIVFDVPAGTVPAMLELHDSMFSGGTKVALR